MSSGSASTGKVLDQMVRMRREFEEATRAQEHRFREIAKTVETQHKHQIELHRGVLVEALQVVIQQPLMEMRAAVEQAEDRRPIHVWRRFWGRITGRPYLRQPVLPIIFVNIEAIERRVMAAIAGKHPGDPALVKMTDDEWRRKLQTGLAQGEPPYPTQLPVEQEGTAIGRGA